MMECRECYEILPLYVDHALTAQEMQEVKKHIQTCRQCGAELKKLADTVALVCNLKAVKPPADFHSRFLCRFQKECRLSLKPWPGWGTLSLASVAAAAAVLLVVIIYNPLPKSNTSQSLVAGNTNHATPVTSSKKPLDDKNILTSDHNVLVKPYAYKNTFKSNNDISLALPPIETLYKTNRSLIKSVSLGGKSAATSAQRLRASPRNPSSGSLPKTTQLFRQTQEWSGDQCAIQIPEYRILRTPEELQSLWTEAQLNSLVIPEINWREQMIGAIFLGKRSEGKYDISLKEIQQQPERWLVKYQVQSATSNQKRSVSNPFHVFLLPQSGYPVDFIEDKSTGY